MAGSGTEHLRDDPDVLLRVENLVVEFPAGRKGTVHAVSDVSFDVKDGETLGLVGESGCGKSTTAKAVIQVPRPTSGQVIYNGTDLAALKGEEMRRMRPEIQMIFQDPISSLNPRRKVHDIVSEGVKVWSGSSGGAFTEDRINELIEAVGLDPVVAGERRPHEFSGGQCQRISIARALVLDPKIVICDEPVSALDVSVQAQILNLLEDMKERYGVSLMFISHDLSVVKNISDRVMVMYMGKTCEIAGSDELFARPTHHYTRALMAAIPGAPTVDEDLSIEGELPSAIDPPAGCRFSSRCPAATDLCRTEEPVLRRVDEIDGRVSSGAESADHYVACHFPVLD